MICDGVEWRSDLVCDGLPTRTVPCCLGVKWPMRTELLRGGLASSTELPWRADDVWCRREAVCDELWCGADEKRSAVLWRAGCCRVLTARSEQK